MLFRKYVCVCMFNCVFGEFHIEDVWSGFFVHQCRFLLYVFFCISRKTVGKRNKERLWVRNCCLFVTPRTFFQLIIDRTDGYDAAHGSKLGGNRSGWRNHERKCLIYFRQPMREISLIEWRQVIWMHNKDQRLIINQRRLPFVGLLS